MNRFVAAALMSFFVATLGFAASGETLTVRSGEHADFTRLVVETGGAKSWRLGRVGSGYELRVEGATVDFAIGDVFSRIPRSRLTELAVGSQPGALRLDMAPRTHAVASSGAGGRIIIDLRDGAAPDGSPFETALLPDQQEQQLAATTQERPGTSGMNGPPASWFSQDPDAALPLLWRGIATSDTDAGAASLANPALAALPPVAAQPDVAADPPTKEEGSAEVEIGNQVDSAQQGWDAFSELASPDRPEIQDGENELLRQLSRAVAQGLVVVEHSSHTDLAPAKPDDPVALPADPERSVEPTAEALVDNPLAAETAMDRDALSGRVVERFTSEGDGCVPDTALDIAAWGGEGPYDRQLAEARMGLVGEFDRPDPKAVERVARLYVFLGLGAEARQVLKAFRYEPQNAGVLHDVARLMDGMDLPANSRLPTMAGCNGAVALWAFLGTTEPAADVNVNAVLRSFSALPGQVRALVGERLSDRLLMRGDRAAARSVLNAMGRSTAGAERHVAALGAEMAVDGDHAAEAEATLLEIAKTNDPLSRRSLAAVLRSRLDRGLVSEPALIETAAALAFEHRLDPEGPVFADLEIRSRAHSGDIAKALDAFERWQFDVPEADKTVTFEGLMAAVLTKADDPLFAKVVLSYVGEPEFQAVSGELRLDLARRLNDLGFAELSGVVLAGPTDDAQAAATERARAALALGEPEGVLRLLEAVDGEAADRLRAQALSMMGQHGQAHDAYVAAGDPTAAAAEAWRAGKADQAAAYQAVASPLADIAAASSRGKAPTVSEPSLKNGKAAAESSIALRAALAKLLDGTASDASLTVEN